MDENENVALVKVKDLTNIFKQLFSLQQEIANFKAREDELKAYTIEQTAKLLNLHYNSVRKLVMKGKLFAKHLNGDSGKCIIPLTSIKDYLRSKEDSNQQCINHLKH